MSARLSKTKGYFSGLTYPKFLPENKGAEAAARKAASLEKKI